MADSLHTVIVTGLAGDVKVADLLKLSKTVGKVKKTEIGPDCPEGIVTFANAADAQKAVERLNGVYLCGSPIEVQILGDETSTLKEQLDNHQTKVRHLSGNAMNNPYKTDVYAESRGGRGGKGGNGGPNVKHGHDGEDGRSDGTGGRGGLPAIQNELNDRQSNHGGTGMISGLLGYFWSGKSGNDGEDGKPDGRGGQGGRPAIQDGRDINDYQQSHGGKGGKGGQGGLFGKSGYDGEDGKPDGKGGQGGRPAIQDGRGINNDQNSHGGKGGKGGQGGLFGKSGHDGEDGNPDGRGGQGGQPAVRNSLKRPHDQSDEDEISGKQDGKGSGLEGLSKKNPTKGGNESENITFRKDHKNKEEQKLSSPL